MEKNLNEEETAPGNPLYQGARGGNPLYQGTRSASEQAAESDTNPEEKTDEASQEEDK
jgi:hypothetical protein